MPSRVASLGLGGLVAVAVPGTALAIPPVITDIPQRIDDEGIRIGVRGILESWDEPTLSTSSGNTRGVLAGVSLGVPLHELLVVDFEMGFKRLIGTAANADGTSSGEREVTDLIPLSLLVEGRLSLGAQGEIYAGIGPTLTVFRNDHPGINKLNDEPMTPGSKGAGEVRVGFRIDTGLIQPARAPGMGRQIRAVDFEGYAGRRWQLHPRDEGFDLAAWRLGLGLSFRF